MNRLTNEILALARQCIIIELVLLLLGVVGFLVAQIQQNNAVGLAILVSIWCIQACVFICFITYYRARSVQAEGETETEGSNVI